MELIMTDYFLGSENLPDELSLRFFFVNCPEHLDFSKYTYYL